MKKIYFLLTVLLLSAFTALADNIAFEIYPEESGTFEIFYSTYDAPATAAVVVDWGDGVNHSYPRKETGAIPSYRISGEVTKGEKIVIFSDHLDAIYIKTKASQVLPLHNPHLQYVYYLHNNLSSFKLENLYNRLNDRNGKGEGELYLVNNKTNVYSCGLNIAKSNAFIATDKNWTICSYKAWSDGDPSERRHWGITENIAKNLLLPAIEIKTPSTNNIDIQLRITYLKGFPVKIKDGADNFKTLDLKYFSDKYFPNYATKYSVKGGTIKIYGASIIGLKTSGISSLDLSNTTNMQYLYINNSSNLNSLPGLNANKLLKYVRLYNTGLTSIDLSPLSNLETLYLPNNYKLQYLYYNTGNLKILSVNGCDKLDIGVLSVLKNSKKLTEISVESMGWDACALDKIYRNLYSPAPSGAKIYIEDTCEPYVNFNDYEGSNKTIATNKGWKVMLEYNCGAEKELTGDGGGCIPAPGAITRPAKVKLTGIKNGDELKWIFGDNTTEYKLLLGTSSTPKDVVVPFTSSLATSYILTNLQYNTKYYWQVIAKNASGETEGPVWYFTTEDAPKPGAVTNTSPADGATDIENGELLKWTFGGNTREHEVLLDTKYPPANVGRAYQTKMMSSHELNDLKPNTKYYWQVNAKNASGPTPGPVWSFTTAPASAPKPDAVTNTSPADGAADIENGELLKWTFGGNTREHEVLLDTKYPPANVGRSYQTKMISSHELNDLKPNTKYYWQVNAKNAAGTTPGPVWSFTTSLKTGTFNPDASDAIQIYTNGNALHLVTPSQEVAMVKVYNLAGQLLLQGKTNGNAHSTLNISALSHGVYVVRVMQKNGVVINRKVPIQKQ